MILLLLLIILVSSPSFADTLLLGHDYYGQPYNDTSCYYVGSNSINGAKWKGYRIQATSSGAISYFKVTVLNVPNGCSNDDVIWAVYEDNGTTTYPGNLKTYGYVEGYDWTRIGVGTHRFDVTHIATDQIITYGNYYWLVFYAHAIDRDNYTHAGCSSQIYNNRGRETYSCVSGVSSFRYSVTPEYPPPPAGRTFTASHNSYFDWSLWEDVGGTGSTTSVPNTTTTTSIRRFCPIRQIYGKDSQETKLLRYIRDNVLSKSQEGQELIKLYYQWSPFIVRAMEEDEEFNQEVKDIIDDVLLLID